MKIYKISKNNLFIFIGAIFFKILLDFAYIKLISPYFSYTGMILDFNLIKYLESTFVTIIIIALISNIKKTFYEFFLKMFILTGYLPVASYYALTDNYREWFYIWTLFCIIVIFFSKIKIVKLKTNLKTLKEGKYIALFFSLSIITLSLFLVMIYFGSSINFNLLDVYELRYEHHLSKIPFGGYLINWSVKVFIPFLILFFLYHRHNLGLVILLIILQIYFFATTGHKSYLFILLLILILPIFLDVYEKIMLISLVSIIFLGFGLYLFFDDIIVSSLLIRRVFFVPAQLSFFYYDFFNDKYLFLSHSILKYFFNYKYDLAPSQIIGSIYLGNPDTNANNGIVTDAFINFGILGVIAWAISVVFLLKLLDYISEKKEKKILFPLNILSSYNFINSAFLTTLFTHGLLLILLLSLFLKNKKITSV